MFLRKKVAFIRDNGEINIHLLVSQIFLIDICKPVRRMFQRIHLKRIFKLCCVTILYINIMIIKLTKHRPHPKHPVFRRVSRCVRSFE